MRPIYSKAGVNTDEQPILILSLKQHMINGIGETFANLSELGVIGSPIIQSIERRHFENLPNLKLLYVGDVRLLAEDAFDDLLILDNLEIGWNDDLVLERLLQNIKNLKKIILRGFPVNFVPGEVFRNFKGLETLALQESNMLKLEKSFLIYFTKIKEIRLDYSNINYVAEDTFQDCTSLEILSFNGCKIEKLSEKTFWNLKKLKTLSVGKTNLKSIPLLAFRDLTNLEELELSYAKIESLDENLFKNLENLKILKCSKNPIKSFHENTFKPLVNLKELDLSLSNIETLPAGFFGSNLKLEEILLWSNRLKVIEVDFTSFAKLKYLSLKENVCISETFSKETRYTTVTSIQELQKKIGSNCTALRH